MRAAIVALRAASPRYPFRRSREPNAARNGALIRLDDQPSTIIGWREWIGLPRLGIAGIAAKIDTGARTTALHALDIEHVESAEGPLVRFTVPAGPGHETLRVEAPLVAERGVKNTSGVPESRPVIATTLSLGRRRWPIEVTLADRTEMGFDVILGRTAIRRRAILVDCARSWLARPPRGFEPPSTEEEDPPGESEDAPVSTEEEA